MTERPDMAAKRKILRHRYGEPANAWDKFREFIFVEQLVGLPRANWEARALFCAIQLAFDGSGPGGSVTVSPYLIHNLAACAVVSIDYAGTRQAIGSNGIPWHDHDDVTERTFTGFVHTIIAAIRNGELKEVQKKLYFGALEIPDWFIVWAKFEAVPA